MKQRQETKSGHTPRVVRTAPSNQWGLEWSDGALSWMPDEESARLIAQAPTLLSQRDRLAAALRGMLSGAEYVNSRAKAGQRAFMSQTACDDARALLAEIDGEGEA